MAGCLAFGSAERGSHEDLSVHPSHDRRAIEFLGAALTQAKFDQVIVRLELDNDIALASPKSVTAKSALLAQAITRRAAQIVTTVNGRMTLAEAAVRIAVEISVPAYGRPEQASFLRGLALDGYVVSWDEVSRAPLLRAALPEEVDMPVTDDEVHQLLKHFNFIVAMGHLIDPASTNLNQAA